ncbi:MAG: futalosine hydrolase [Pirellulaceae bacterium]|nr:futalosine hydrolase [Pirellulaceae bacterium]
MTRGCDLILIPTEMERSLCQPQLSRLTRRGVARVELCGLGLVHSAAFSAAWIAQLRPHQVWLLGIAGSYHDQLPLGTACEFTEVACYGIGVGGGADWVSAERLGWLELFSGPTCPGDVIDLTGDCADSQRQLLTVCAASANSQEVQLKRQYFPAAQAEDMESYSVAAVCQQFKVPLRVIRGLSNRAGDRAFDTWQSRSAMMAAVQLAESSGCGSLR